MNKYTVQLEFDVTSCDLALITVEANSPEEARINAVKLYHSNDCPDLDYYASNAMESTLSDINQMDWEVEEINPTKKEIV